MAIIEWDKSGERRFETGVDHGVLYPWDSANNTYGTGVAWNGLSSVSASPDGAEPTDIWADNMKYAVLRSAETYGGTIEAYTFPDEYYECDGSRSPITGVHIGQQSRKAFGFTYRTKVGDDTDTEASKYKIHIVYNATASPSERTYETVNDSPDAITMSWEFTTTPVNVSGYENVYKPTSEITIDVWTLTTPQKTALENKLYGTQSTEPTLPDPAALLALISGATTTT